MAAAAADPALYQWSAVPVGRDAVSRYIETALAWREAGKAVPFATVRIADGAVLGSTRFFDIESWAWPDGHERHGRRYPDVCEIGYTWLTRDAIRTAANTEAKLLMLAHAFEVWQVLRVCLHTDARNQRSQAAIERIGGKFEGVLRAHRMAADYPGFYRYSIVARMAGGKAELVTLARYVEVRRGCRRSATAAPSLRQDALNSHFSPMRDPDLRPRLAPS